jgi:hypothetical protein
MPQANSTTSSRERAQRVRQHLAVFARDQTGQFVGVFFDQFLETEHDARAAHRRRRRPGGKGAHGRSHGGGDFSGGSQRHMGTNRAGRWIKDLTRPARCSRDARAVNKMVQVRQGNPPISYSLLGA